MQNEKVAVQFVTSCSPYTQGEVAGFAPNDAKKLVTKGLAQYWKPATAVEEEVVEDVDDEQNDGNTTDGEGSAGDAGEGGGEDATTDSSTKRTKRVKLD